MKRIVVTLIILFPCVFLSKAQQLPCDFNSSQQTDTPQERVQSQRPNQDEIESRKIAFLASAITLTPVEAAHFWPVYNEWSKKLGDNMRMRHTALRKIRQLGKEKSMDEKIYAQQSKILIDGNAEEARIVAEAHKAYVALLGEVRTAKLYLAEEQFREMMIRELRQNAK